MNDLELRTKVEELADVMRKGKKNGDIISLPSESYERAGELFDKAISIIEDITGEQWDFSYITF